jgi:hypothetical protein
LSSNNCRLKPVTLPQGCGWVAHSKTGRYRIGSRHDDRDRLRGIVRGLSGFWAVSDDDVDGQPDQIGGHRGQSAQISSGEPVLDRDVLAVDIPEFVQSFAEGIEPHAATAPRRLRIDRWESTAEFNTP